MFKFNQLKKEIVLGKHCLVRVDFNSSFEKGKLKSSFRIKKTLPLINWLLDNRAKIILMTHTESESGAIPCLNRLFDFLKQNYFNDKIYFANGITDKKTSKKINDLREGEILLLDNLRLDAREETNSKDFSRELSSLADIYINEAFSASHREHASITGIPKFLPAFPGFNFLAEIENLSKVFRPEHPFLIVMGGKKIHTNAPVIEKFLKTADHIIAGGLMAVEFYAAQGKKTGKTDIDKSSINLVKEKFLGKEKIILPEDFTVLRENNRIEVSINEIQDNDIVCDIAPCFFDTILDKIFSSRLILWNGPMGVIEQEFLNGTNKLLYVLKTSKAEIIAGGGETAEFIEETEAADIFSFVSTAGGAMLDFLAEETLTGIEALRADKNKKNEI